MKTLRFVSWIVLAVLMWVAFALNLPLLFSVGATWFTWIGVPALLVVALWATMYAIVEGLEL